MIFFAVKRINPYPVCDAMMPMFVLGLGVTRIGCLLNGCCYGLPADDGFGMVFPYDSAAGCQFPDTPLIPTQLYSSLAGFAILGIVLFTEKFKRFDGHSFWLTLGLYGMWRFLIDFWRFYEDSMVFTIVGTQTISRNQALSAALLVVSVVVYTILCIKYKRARE